MGGEYIIIQSRRVLFCRAGAITGKPTSAGRFDVTVPATLPLTLTISN